MTYMGRRFVVSHQVLAKTESDKKSKWRQRASDISTYYDNFKLFAKFTFSTVRELSIKSITFSSAEEEQDRP